MTIGLMHFLWVSVALFVIGLVGLAASRKHLVKSLIALEVLLLSVHVLFVSFSAFHGQIHGQIVSLFVLAIAAAEAAIGLALLLIFFRQRKTVRVEDMTALKK